MVLVELAILVLNILSYSKQDYIRLKKETKSIVQVSHEIVITESLFIAPANRSTPTTRGVAYIPVKGLAEEGDDVHNVNIKPDNKQEPTPFPTCAEDFANKVEDAQGSQRHYETASSSRRRLATRSLETISCILAIAALLAIVGTVYPYHGKPSYEWPIVISLNTLLAIYTMLLKSCMALVVGSSMSQLQWTWLASDRSLYDLVKFCQPLTTRGALITILAIAIDPATQQLLSYVDCNIVQGGKVAILPRTNYYKGHGRTGGFNAEGAPIEVTIEPSMQAVINGGLFGSPYVVIPDCASGNCTFAQTYSTVGYCSKCEDISDSIKILNETCYVRSSSTTNYFPKTYSTDTNASVITSALLNTNSISFDEQITNLSVAWNDGPGSNDNPVVAAMQITDSALSSPSGYGLYWTQVLIGKTTYSLQRMHPDGSGPVTGCNSSAADDLWSCRGFGAAQCTLKPCVREYNATVNAGRLQETVVESTDPFLVWGYGDDNGTSLGAMALLDTYCTTAQENSQLTTQGYKLNTTRWTPYNVTVGYSNSPLTAPFSRCIYAIDYLFADDLYFTYLVNYFNGTITANIFNENFIVGQVSGPQPLQAMYNVGNFEYNRVEEIFHNISDSMTAFIRSAGEDGLSDPATGEVLHHETCLRVKWAWLAMPAALVLLTVVCFAWTITATIGDPAWKQSPLAMVFHGPWAANPSQAYGLMQSQIAKLNTVEGMEEVAKSIVVNGDRTGPLDRQIHMGYG
ncbi:hypothetical protein F5884DRAFT_873444 [Xylogone sp. PMI_703]|nr:hypothetical protein F5884DRAFT_873444 [Xylogone sp. PMI_703]